VYHGVSLGRRETNGNSEFPLLYSHFRIETYSRWLSSAIRHSRQRHPEDRRFVFLDSWNRWEDGLTMEPDTKRGYLTLNQTSRALLGLSPTAIMPKVSVIVPSTTVAFWI
jgi:Glycosyltransferase WbsX